MTMLFICNAMMLIPVDATFGTVLHTRSTVLIHEFLVLTQSCLTGGEEALTTLVQDRVVGVWTINLR